MKQEKDLSAVKDRISGDEQRVNDNGIAVRRIEGDFSKQMDNLKTVSTDVSSMKVFVQQNKVDIKDIKGQFKSLGKSD